MTRPPSTLLACAVMTWLAIAPAPARELTQLLPPKTERMVYIRDVSATLDRIRSSPFGRFYRDPRNKDFTRPLRELLGEGKYEFARFVDQADAAASGSKSENLAAGFTGGLIVATIAPRSASGKSKPGRLVIYEYDGSEAVRRRALNPARPRGSTLSRKTARVGKLRYTRLIISREVLEEIGVNGKRGRRVRSSSARSGVMPLARRHITTEEHVYIGDDLIIHASGGGEPMKAALVRLASDSIRTSLATHPPRLRAREGFQSDPDIEVYLDLNALTERGLSLANAEMFGSGVDERRLGLGELRSAAVGVSFEPDRLAMDFHVYIPKPRLGVGRLLFMNEPRRTDSEHASALARIVPDDAEGYFAFHSEFGELWKEFRRILREGAPSVGGLMDTYFQAFENETSLDLEKLMFENMTGPWGVFLRAPGGADGSKRVTGADTGGKAQIPQATFFTGVRNAELLRPALERWARQFADLLNYDLAEREIGPWKSFRLIGAEDTAGSFIPLAQFANICLTDDTLFFSPSAVHILASIEHMKATDANAKNDARTDFNIADAAPVRAARAPLAACALLAPFMQERRFLEACIAPGAYQAFFDSALVSLVGGFMGGVNNSILEFDSAPDNDVLGDFFGPGGMSAALEGDRLHAKLFLLYHENN